jgi:DNA-directed RNA polymerase specialized sigma24 family protein
MASIATNAARDRFREENRAAGFGRDLLGDVTLVEQVLTDHRDHGDTIALRDALSTVLRALPERQRDALLARAYEGLSVEQAAGRFALSANAFRQLHFRATANARRAWSRAGAVSATRTS